MALASLRSVDIRTVSIVWSGSGEDEELEIAYSGCSSFEAEALAAAAARFFARINDDVVDDIDDDE